MESEHEPEVSASTTSGGEYTANNIDKNNNSNLPANNAATSTNQTRLKTKETTNDQHITTGLNDTRSPSPYRGQFGKDDSALETSSKTFLAATMSSSIIQHTTNNDMRHASFRNNTATTIAPPPPSEQRQEDTFYQSLQIRLHHSVGSMSISPTCRDVVLAGRQGLVIIDLENPWLIPRILPHMSKWEVADVQWSPYVSRESWVASTSNQKLLIWNLNSSSQAIEHALPAHARAISDINWSPHHPDIVATCSVDTYVSVWDLRCAGQSSQSRSDDHYYRPANSFTPWNAAATQVKFNFKNEYLIASAHDKDVKIWDMRKGAVPMTSITAHSKKIYGIDWSRQNDYDIVTCSLDKLVKYWNIHSPDEPEEIIITNSPVWRARNTPFGNGVLTMPQRSESNLCLYNRAIPDEPVHLFEGHTDTVKEFVWRWKGGLANDDSDDREFQLVTWSKDQNLRLWPVPEEITKSVGHRPSSKKTCYPVPSNAIGSDGSYHSHSFQETPVEDEATDERSRSIAAAVAPIRLMPANTLSFHGTVPPGNVSYSTSYNFPSNNYREQKYTINPLLWMQNVKTIVPNNELRKDTPAGNTYQSLAEELSSVLNKYASVGVKTEKINAAARTCTISLHGPWLETGTAFLRITIRFSQQYPDNSPPEFDIQKNSMISIYYRTHMAQDLNALAANYTSQKLWCLEPCIRYLLGETMQEDEPRFGSGTANGLSTLSPNTTGAPTTNTSTSTALSSAETPYSSASETTTIVTAEGTKLNEKEGGPINQSTTNYVSNWSSTAAEGDSDDEIFVSPSFMGGYGMTSAKRGSLQSERGIVLDLSSKHSADEKVPFPRLCGGVFSGSGQLTCFFSTLRVRDPNRSSNKTDNKNKQETSPASNTSNGEYFEHTYQDFYKHPKSYEQFEEYKEIAAMSRQGRNASVMVGSGGAFGEYTYDDDPDDIDDGLTNMASIYFKPDGSALDNSMKSEDNLLYHGAKSDRITHNVMIADFSDMMPFNPWLAKEFILSPDNPMKACLHNSQVSKTHDRDDLAQIWSISLEIIRECVPLDIPEQQDLVEDLLRNRRPDLQPLPTDPVWLHDSKLAEINSILGHQAFTRLLADVNDTKGKSPDEKTTMQTLEELPKRRVRWGSHPLGQRLVDNLLQHFMHIGDIQMGALLTCVFHNTYMSPHNTSLRQDLKIPRSWGSMARNQPRSGGGDDSGFKSSTVDYFSMKKTKQIMHRTNSGPNLNGAPQTNRNSSHVQLSQSYGTKGVNFLSYFWDNDRRTPPPMEKSPLTETPTDMADDSSAPVTSPTTRNNRISNRMTTRNQPWMTLYSGVKIPSNTAPGIRPSVANSMSSHGTSYISTPPLPTSPSAMGSRVSTPLLPPGSLPLSTPNVLPLGPVTVANKEGEVLATDELSIEYTNVEWFDGEKLFVYNQTPLLPVNKSGQHDVMRWQYGDLLFRNHLLDQRAEVLKFVNNRPSYSMSGTTMTSKERTMEIQVRCYMCESEIAGSDRMCYQCCKIRTQIKCSICHQLVKGLVNFCIKCRHGGHSRHLKEWFQKEDVCPTGCGCHCLLETKDYGTTVL